MRKKLIVGIVVAALISAASAGVAVAAGVWGEATEKPPCSEWNKRVFDPDTGKIKQPQADADGNGIGWSLSAARGLLDEPSCAWVFRPKGDKKNTYWDKRYRLAVTYDAFLVQWASERSRWYPVNSLMHQANYDPEKLVSHDERCRQDGGEIWYLSLAAVEWCNFPDSEGSITGGISFDEGDYVIRGPR